MMMSDDDFQDTGFSNRDVAVRVDVPEQRHNKKDVKLIDESLIQSGKPTNKPK